MLVIDQVMINPAIVQPRETATQPEPEPGLKRGVWIDLPDSGGYVLIALGVICLLYFTALRVKRFE
jgi:hypothetical protein